MRSAARPEAAVGGVILAGGRSRRFGAANKLLALLQGQPLLWHVIDAVSLSMARPLVIVTGHQRAHVSAALRGYRARHRSAPRWRVVYNSRYREGLSTSLQAGLAALPDASAGALIALGDMPGIRAKVIDALMRAYRAGDDAVVPVSAGRRANPVILSRAMFPRVHAELGGDRGAGRLLLSSQRVREIAADASVLGDIDTRRDLRRVSRTVSGLGGRGRR